MTLLLLLAACGDLHFTAHLVPPDDSGTPTTDDSADSPTDTVPVDTGSPPDSPADSPADTVGTVDSVDTVAETGGDSGSVDTGPDEGPNPWTPGTTGSAIDLGDSADVQALWTGDANGDGVADLVYLSRVPCTSSSPTRWTTECLPTVYDVGVVYGDGAGGFTGPDTTSGSVETLFYAVGDVGDLDGDGLVDVVTATGTGFSVFLANGAGYAAPVDTTAPSAIYALGLHDLDGDGSLDLVTRDGMGTVTTWLGDGAGGFTSAGTMTVSASDGYGELGFVDVDGDGLDDVIAGGATPMTVLLSDGAGGFVSSVSFTVRTGVSLQDQALADLDGDGTAELVSVTQDRGIEAYTFATDTLTTQFTPAANDYLYSLVVGDLDDDGALDLVASGTTAGGPAYDLDWWPVSGGTLGAGGSVLSIATGEHGGANLHLALIDADGDGCTDVAQHGNSTEIFVTFGGC